MEFKNYLIYFLISGLAIISVVYFGAGLMSSYDKSYSVIDESQINLSGLKTQINETSNDAIAWQKSFTSDNLFIATGSIVLFSIWGIAKLMFSGVNSFVTIIFQAFVNVLHIPPVVLGIIIVVLILGMIMAAWSLMKSGG